MNDKPLRGVVHGNAIELEGDVGIADGVQVEVVLRSLGPSASQPGDGFLRTEGALSNDSEWDPIMAEIQQARNQERRSLREDA